jgi:3-isopropylmalate/(R)-2-methylmalate dehydratase large subunit
MFRTPPSRRVGQVDAAPRTLAHKVWDAHRVEEWAADGQPTRLRVDRVLLHEHQVGLLGRAHEAGVIIRGADRVVVCADQQTPTIPAGDEPRPGAQQMGSVDRLEQTSDAVGLPLFGPGDERGGVLNVVAAEQGMVLPGDLVVGADGHVATLGALGALALVIADAEVAEVVATGTVSRSWPGVARVTATGALGAHATGKDLALWLLGRLGTGSISGRVVELGGPIVRQLGVEDRMALCNLMVGSGASSVFIPPDRLTEDYLRGRPFAPSGHAWEAAGASWRSLGSDRGADYDGDLGLLASTIEPLVTWGTALDQVAALAGTIPEPRPEPHGELDRRALREQGLEPGRPIGEIAVDQVFIGSCANARIEDLRAAASLLERAGGRVQVPSWVVPGSWPVKHQAEAEGLHRVFLNAGFEWRDPGCSLCIGSNGDAVEPGTRLASTANRPHRGLIGPGARVHLLSPVSAAATALVGRLSSPQALD